MPVKRGGFSKDTLRVKVAHSPLRETAVSSSLQCVSFLSSSSSAWPSVEDSISLVVSDKKLKHLSEKVCQSLKG